MAQLQTRMGMETLVHRKCAISKRQPFGHPILHFDMSVRTEPVKALSLSNAFSIREVTYLETWLGWKRRQLQLVRPARSILRMQVIERLGNLDWIHYDLRSLLSNRQCPRAR